jgi:protein-S-isoprenylcysteine O-methyltransferase Ste14
LLAAGLIIAGIALRIAAIRTLGARFVSSTTVDRVVVRGPYRWMHHPSELGLLAIAAGSAALVGSPLAATLAGFVLLPLSVFRCAGEDRELAPYRASPVS